MSEAKHILNGKLETALRCETAVLDPVDATTLAQVLCDGPLSTYTDLLVAAEAVDCIFQEHRDSGRDVPTFGIITEAFDDLRARIAKAEAE